MHLDDFLDDEPANVENLPTGDLEAIDTTISKLSNKIASFKPLPKPSNHHIQNERQPPTKPNSTKHTQHNKQQPLQEIQNVANNM